MNAETINLLPTDIVQTIESAPKWEDIIETTDVVSITGRRRHGKSVLLYQLLELLAEANGLYKYAWGIPTFKQTYFSGEIEHFEDIEEIADMPYGCIGLDELHRAYSARSSMNEINKRFSEIMTFTGQRNQILLMATLNNALIDIDTFRITNPILIYKRVGRIQAKAERHATKEFTMKAAKEWQKIPHGKRKTPIRALECSLSYIVSDEYEGWILNDKPDWWNEDASEMHNKKSEKEYIVRKDLSQYKGEYETFIFNKVVKFPIHQLKRKSKELRKNYPIERFYLEKILPTLEESK